METIMVLSNGSVLSRKEPHELRPSVPPIEIKPGPYFTRDGFPARVKKSVSTDRLYAEKMNAQTGKFEYERGLVYNLGERMTLEQAREWGARLGRCAICGAKLTDNKSVDDGIGPVCIKKLRRTA